MRISKTAIVAVLAAACATTAATGAGAVSLNMVSSAHPFVAGPSPDPAYVPSAKGPAKRLDGARRGTATVTVNPRPCVVINRGGGDLTVTTNNVRPDGLIGVTDYLVDPSGKESAKVAPHNNGALGWQWKKTLPWNAKPGVWAAYSTSSNTFNGAPATRYANSTDFCVQENAYFGTVHLSDARPTAGQHITVTGGFYIHRNSGKNVYAPGGLRWVQLYYRDTAGAWSYLGGDQTNTKGVYSKNIVTPGPGKLYLVYGGSETVTGVRSNAVLLSATVN